MIRSRILTHRSILIVSLALLAALSFACGPTRDPNAPPTLSIDCIASAGPDFLVPPYLNEILPAQARPGEQVRLTGIGGFYKPNSSCSPLLLTPNPPPNLFPLYLDDQKDKSISQISCQLNICEALFNLPLSISPGEHTLSTEGGSSIKIEVLASK